MKAVNRKQKSPYAGLKPLYLDSTAGNAVDLMDHEDPTVYIFRRLSGQ
jgi:hypothetical protein